MWLKRRMVLKEILQSGVLVSVDGALYSMVGVVDIAMVLY
jgi:hypothetical protein